MANQPKFIWTEPSGVGRNLFCSFRRTVTLTSAEIASLRELAGRGEPAADQTAAGGGAPGAGEPAPSSEIAAGSETPRAVLHLFADSYYRLRVDGTTLFYGPERFTPNHPHYDSIDLASWLNEGQNEIEVLVHSEGSPNFQHMPSRAGFIAWGAIFAAEGSDGGSARESIDLATPGDWECREEPAWDRKAERYSFAQGPLELLDTRELAGSAWKPPVLCEPQDHWGPFTPRELPPPTLRTSAVERTLLLAGIDTSEQRIAFRYEGPEPDRKSGSHLIPHRLFLHATEPCAVELGLYGGRYWLGGSELVLEDDDPNQGRRLVARAQLTRGANELVGLARHGDVSWPVLIGVTAAGSVTVSARREEDDASVVAYLPAEPGELSEASQPSASAFEGATATYVSRSASHAPCRELAWDRPARETLLVDERTAALATCDIDLPAGSSMAVFDMGDEFFGRLVIEITAGCGAVLDVGYDERLDENGTVGFYRREQNNNTADRYVLAGERQRIEGFHERGGRYIQIAVRNSDQPVVVHTLAIAAATASWPQTGTFACSDPTLAWSWQAGVKTLQVSMGDGGWVDPWRERGLYLGDSIVEAHATRKFTSDPRMTRWALRLWANTQKEDGQMRDVTPGWKESPLIDYSLIWILLLRDYCLESGDVDLVRELWPNVARVLESPVYSEREGVWDGGELRTFTDWGAVQDARFGVNAALNAFRYAAFEAAGQLAKRIERHDQAVSYREERHRAAKAFSQFFDPEAGRYLARLDIDAPQEIPAYHANILALRFGLVPEERASSVLAYIKEGLSRNLTFFPGHVELYFFYYLLPALYDRGEGEFAEQLMRDHYGLIKAYGATTLVETAERLVGGIGSYCHGWSTGNMVHLTERVLGVRRPSLDRPELVVIAPQAASVEWASGTYPHERGLVSVSWRVSGDRLLLDYRAPDGVEVSVEPRGRLAALRLITTRISFTM